MLAVAHADLFAVTNSNSNADTNALTESDAD